MTEIGIKIHNSDTIWDAELSCHPRAGVTSLLELSLCIKRAMQVLFKEAESNHRNASDGLAGAPDP